MAGGFTYQNTAKGAKGDRATLVSDLTVPAGTQVEVTNFKGANQAWVKIIVVLDPATALNFSNTSHPSQS